MRDFEPDPGIIALGVRQPWAELIVRGIKTIEVRSQNTRMRGTIYLYAAKKFSTLPAARVAVGEHQLDRRVLPAGFLVGSVEIAGSRRAAARDARAACVPAALLAGQFAWELHNARRFRDRFRSGFSRAASGSTPSAARANSELSKSRRDGNPNL